MPWGWIVLFMVLIGGGVATFLFLTGHHRSHFVPANDDTDPSVTPSVAPPLPVAPVVKVFGAPQRLTDPTDNTQEFFGSQVWVHDQGFLVVATDTHLHFYYTDTRGALQYDSTKSVTSLLTESEKSIFTNHQAAPIIVHGCFSPSLNLFGESFYLAVSIGHVINGYRFGRVVVLLTYTVTGWTVAANRFTPPTFLFSPFEDTVWTERKAIGQLIKMVVDQTQPDQIDGQIHVYLNATNVVASRPGGSVLWFTLSSGQPTFVSQIRDSRLQAIWDSSSKGSTFITAPFTTFDFLNSFGSTFDVVCSDSDPINAILAIANPGVEDSTYEVSGFYGGGVAPGGYIQIFYRNDQNTWSMNAKNLARFVGTKNYILSGLGSTLMLLPNRELIMGVRNPSVQLYSFALPLAKDLTDAAIDMSTDTRLLAVTFDNLKVDHPTARFFSVRFLSVANQWMVSAFNVTDTSQTNVCAGLYLIDPKETTKRSFLLQQGLVTTAAMGRPATDSPISEVLNVAFGQSIGTWVGGRNVFVAVNDPFERQVWIYSQSLG